MLFALTELGKFVFYTLMLQKYAKKLNLFIFWSLSVPIPLILNIRLKIKKKNEKPKISAGKNFGGTPIFGGKNFGFNFRRNFVPPKFLVLNVVKRKKN